MSKVSLEGLGTGAHRLGFAHMATCLPPHGLGSNFQLFAAMKRYLEGSLV